MERKTSKSKKSNENNKNLKFIIEKEKDSNKQSIFGIIIGGPQLKYEKETKQYIKKIKIIDESFNFTKKIDLHKLKFHKFVTVSLYSKNKEDFENICEIGDIIWLRRFYFKLYPSGSYQANEVEFSNWLIFKRDSKNNIPKSFKNFSNNENKILNGSEIKRIKELRSFSEEFFRKHSLLFIDWYQDYNSEYLDKILKELDNPKKTNRDFIGLVESKKGNYFILKDIYENKFKLLDNKKFKFIKGEVYMLKYIDVILNIKKDSEVNLTEKTCVYNLSKNFYDYIDLKNIKDKSFDELKYENGNMKYIKKVFPFINDFNAESHHFINHFKVNKKNIEYSLVKNSNTKLKDADLNDLMDNTKNVKGKTFLVTCKILSLAKGFQNLNNIIKQHCLSCKKIDNFQDKLKMCCNKKMKITYNLIFNICSLEDKKNKTEVYMLSDNNNSYIFDTWRILPQIDNENKWDKINKTDLELFRKKLIEFVNKKPIVKLGIEIFNANKKGILKIKDTIFLPFN